MNNNRLTLKMGGKERDLLYDFGTLDHIESITGEDPLSFSFEVNNYQSFKKGSFVLVYAGLLSSCDEKNIAADFTKEQVEVWMKRLSNANIMQVINAWGTSKNLIASGEEANHTQSEATNVAGH